MGIKTNVTIECDNCKTNIPLDVNYVNAMTYGAVFCIKCYRAMNAHTLVRLLNLDEIKLMKYDHWEGAQTVCHLPTWEHVK